MSSSMSAALSALRAAGRRHLSASKLTERKATGSHVFQIDTYEKIRRITPKGEKIRSGTFTVGGHDWRVACYPNGYQKHDGSLSLYIEHASHHKTGDATAVFGLSILDQAGWKPSYPHVSGECRFSGTPSTDDLTWGWRDFAKHEDLDKQKYLKDDCLTVVCDVTVTGLHVDDHTEVAEPEPALVVPPASPPFDLHGARGEAIWNKKKPDVKIEAGGETFVVHRWVLDSKSPVFKADLSLASAGGEGAAELRIDDMDADVCKALLQFIYIDRLDLDLVRFICNEIPGTDLTETAAMAERLLVAADRYKLEALKQLCERALLPSVRPSSVVATLALAERRQCPELREACIRFLSSGDNLDALAETDGFQKMTKDCPSAVLELLMKQKARLNE